MREKLNFQAGKRKASCHHPIRQQLMAAFLGICLILASIPLPQFSLSAEAAEQQELPAEVLDLPVGTEEETQEQKFSPLKGSVTADEGKGRETDGLKRDELKHARFPLGKMDVMYTEEAKEPASPQEPGCGVISEDTIWQDPGQMQDGELIVMPGVTLTICEPVEIVGNVTIKGGGTIIRKGGALKLYNRVNLHLENITIDGGTGASSMITLMENNKLVVDDGCMIKNCRAGNGGAINLSGRGNDVVVNRALIENCSATYIGGAIYGNTPGNKIILNNATIRDCSASRSGGAIYATYTDVTINGGCYENNRITDASDLEGFVGGGFIFICMSTLTVNDGIFNGNTSISKGGCIAHCGHADTRTYIRGGTFTGNTCSNQKYAGSGALYNSTVDVGDTSVTISGDVKFAGISEDSGVDGIYLDAKDQTLRKIQISDTLTYPVKLYLKPQENYVIAQGVEGYEILKKRDMKKISFVDVTDSEKKWYAVLDKEGENNQVYLSTVNPGYGCFVYYIKNGAKGTVVTDDNEYEPGDEVTVKSQEGLHIDGKIFAGWNTKADGSGTMYGAGDTFEIEDDTDLYAIFKEKTQYNAEFYSGSAGNKETVAAKMEENIDSGTVIAPEPKLMDGYTFVGWEEKLQGFAGEIKAGDELTLNGDASYYGVYEKNITLSYDANGGDVCPDSEVKPGRINVGKEISYRHPEFTAAGAITRPGYVFAGWNTQKDGSGAPYDAGAQMTLESDMTLYAVWLVGEGAPYRVEHYWQDVEGNGYTRVNADTEYKIGSIGDVVSAEPNPYTGFTQSVYTGLDKSSGIVRADGSLVLQVFYDRDIYQISFDLNGGAGKVPQTQNVRYGGLLKEPEEPQRRGYTFKGWYKEANGKESSFWDIYSVVEENTASRKTTLYAKWADETAPVLGEVSFGAGSRSFADWVVGRRKLTISVPVIEEGSGLKQGDYSLEPEKGEAKQGAAIIRMYQRWTKAVRARSGGVSAVMTVHGNDAGGQYTAVVTIDEDFKGSVFLTCSDNAGNISVRKALTADGAGAVVEDNAPEIYFSKEASGAVKADKSQADRDGRNKVQPRVTINVDVSDRAGEKVTAGLSSVSYQLDGGKARAVGVGEFKDAMVEDYSFAVDIEGEGKHNLQVTAADNAGNETTRKAMVEISKGRAAIVPGDKTPPGAEKSSPKLPGREPSTGEQASVKIFATLGMIAGFTYLLLYFKSGDSGITEREKKAVISRLVHWAQKGKLRKYPALLLISLFLLYYHSIGKSVGDEWRKVCEG